MEGLLDGLQAADFEDLPSSDPADPSDDLLTLGTHADTDPELSFLLPLSEVPQVGFATGGGKKLAPPSEASLLRAKRLLDDPPEDETSTKRARIATTGVVETSRPTGLDSGPCAPPASPHLSGFMTAGGSQAPPVKADRASVLAMFGEEPPQTAAFRSPLQTASSSLQSRVHQVISSNPVIIDTGATGASPFRAPLRTTTNTFGTPKAKTFVTPKTVRRIGMGTPRNRSSFPSPFRAPAPATFQVQTVWKSVFDLRPIGRRIPIASFFSDSPQACAWPELRSINPQTSAFVQFEGWRGSGQAFSLLKAQGCYHATSQWVLNHWSLIVWKLAGQVCVKPSLYQSWWTFDEVLRQLKYRYEREYGEAQRPIIRRIQEHDSSSSLPMILCVSHIDEEVEGAYNVELTDGWYRIGACFDLKLSKSIKDGKIKVGRKLAISGSKLSSAEAQSVLEATAKLMVTANCCALARWDAKLGRHAEPFVSNLTKLDVNGGMIPLMDVYIDKIFPIAFIRSGKMQNNSPWDEVEEQEKQEQWNEKYQNTMAQLQEEKGREMDRVRDVTEAILTYAEGIECPMHDLPDSLENDFDDLLESTDLFKRIKAFSDPHLVHLVRYAQIRLQREEAEKHAEIEAELRTVCPARDVRDFRVVRISDARAGNRPMSRVGMINVWEAKAMGEELQEGGRYMVSNLTPGKSGQWEWPVRAGKPAEIYLHTRRETRWTQL